MQNNKKINLKLFNFIPLVKIKNKNNTLKVKLFNFIPLIRVKTSNGASRVKLFNFIPIIKIKESKQEDSKNNQKLDVAVINKSNEAFMRFMISLYQDNLEKKRIDNPMDIKLFLKNNKGARNITHMHSKVTYIDVLLNIKPFYSIKDLEKNDSNLYYVWGLRETRAVFEIFEEALFNNITPLIFEMGFLYSVSAEKNSNYNKGISFVIDDLTPYYDATRQSRLEHMLNSDLELTDEQLDRSKSLIKKIVDTKLTKYNHQPIFEPKIGRDGVKKVLVVDQAYGDYSIVKGGGSDKIFELMLEAAIKDNPEADIIIKTHPDTLYRDVSCYYSKIKEGNNIYKTSEGINPFSLMEIVDKVYVCTTQFGFEALMMGKEVYTFGIPFYSNWGLTEDYQTCARRIRKRTMEEIFYITYIMYSHYVDPRSSKVCEIEEAVDYLLEEREKYFKRKK